MSGLRWAPPPSRERLRRALRGAVGRLGRPLRVLAEDVAGLDGSIDLVAADPAGRAVLILIGNQGEDLELVALGLAQRAWLAPRLADWIQLAPELDLRPALGVEVMLVAPDFGTRARAAARAADPEGIRLVRARFAAADGGEPGLLLETLAAAGPAPAAAPIRAGGTGAPRVRSRFRTGLSEGDLGSSETA